MVENENMGKITKNAIVILGGGFLLSGFLVFLLGFKVIPNVGPNANNFLNFIALGFIIGAPSAIIYFLYKTRYLWFH